MNLVYIANARLPTEKAHGIQIMQMCEAFGKFEVRCSMFDVELVIPRRINWIKKDPFEYYGVERNFKITRLPCLDLIPLDKYIGHFGLWIESITFLISVFFYLLFTHAPVPPPEFGGGTVRGSAPQNPERKEATGVSPWSFTSIKHQASNIIYTRDILLLPLVIFRKNLFFEAHTFPKNYFLYAPFLKKLKGIIVITRKLKDLFIKNGLAYEKILVAPDGVDIEMFDVRCSMLEARKKLNLPQDKKIVLYTGHLYSWKGVDNLAQASQYLPKDVEIYFVGGTEIDKKNFELRTSNFERIHIIGHRPHSEIPYWLKAADVLVLPNSTKEDISKYWTSPIKMFEYMASRRPIVASDLPSITEILNKNNAVLVEPDNPKALAEGIKMALENEELAEKISNQAFQDVQGYTWEKRVERILDFFNLCSYNT